MSGASQKKKYRKKQIGSTQGRVAVAYEGLAPNVFAGGALGGGLGSVFGFLIGGPIGAAIGGAVGGAAIGGWLGAVSEEEKLKAVKS